MPENQPARLQSLDILRSLAILLVFCFHFPKNHGAHLLGWVGLYGWIGVDLFFVLSGYLIGHQILSSLKRTGTLQIKRFYARRFLRTLPNYLVVLALYFLIPQVREQENLSPLWKFLTFTQNFGLTSAAFSHAWSLCIEEQFYVLLPICAIVLFRVGKPQLVWLSLLVVFTLGLVTRYFAWREFSPLQEDEMWSTFIRVLYHPTWNRLDGLWLGVAVAAVKIFKPGWWARLIKNGNALSVIGLAIFLLALIILWDRSSLMASVFGYPVLAFSFAIWVVCALSPDSWFYQLRLPGASRLALISYAFYLVHKSVIHLTVVYLDGKSQPHPIFAVESFALSLLVSAALYAAVEKPFLKLRDRL